MAKDFRKYLAYAVGEMVLVIAGILIALQIDNWNSDRVDREALQKHLQAVARNVESDLASIAELRTDRERAYELSLRWINFAERGANYTLSEILFAGSLLAEVRLLREFSARKTGFQALQVSGTMDEIQGTDIEQLLYDYYDTVARINAKEQSQNELTRMRLIEFYADWPDGLESWEVNSAWALTAPRFEELQPTYRQLFDSVSTTQIIFGMQQGVASVIHEYDTLYRIGRAVIELVNADSMRLDESTTRFLNGIYDPRSGTGYPDLIIDGRVSWPSFFVLSADANDPRVSYEANSKNQRSPFRLDSFVSSGDSLHIRYFGRAAWAGIWLAVGTDALNVESADFSRYDRLLLELKGESDGEIVFVNMDDRDDPQDGTSTRLPIQLSDQWRQYEINLNEFETADLSILKAVGFVFFEEPVAFSIRTVKFLELSPDE